MGGRSGPSSRQILGSGKRGKGGSPGLEKKLRTEGTKIVANAAFQAAAVGNPVLGAAYAAYEAAKFTYPIVKKGVEEYQRRETGTERSRRWVRRLLSKLEDKLWEVQSGL